MRVEVDHADIDETGRFPERQSSSLRLPVASSTRRFLGEDTETVLREAGFDQAEITTCANGRHGT